MKLKRNIQNLRNGVDYYLRSRIRWSRPISASVPISAKDARIQSEVDGFLRRFNWQGILSRFDCAKRLTVADIGARNFGFAPVFEDIFQEWGYEVELHGIEIDAYRRLSDFHTRADYGHYYAKLVRHGQYHPVDFLQWHRHLHVAFMLNPFVTSSPLLAWGLPLSKLNPDAIFRHVFDLLRHHRGVLLLSCPSKEEFKVAVEMAERVGFEKGERHNWEPPDDSVQEQARYGKLLRVP